MGGLFAGLLLFVLLAVGGATATTWSLKICSPATNMRWNETDKPDFSYSAVITAELRLCVAACDAGDSYRTVYVIATLDKAFVMLGPRLYDGLTYGALDVTRRTGTYLVVYVCNSTQLVQHDDIAQEYINQVRYAYLHA